MAPMLGTPPPQHAQADTAGRSTRIQIPASMQQEHHEIQEAVAGAVASGGPVGDAARELARVLRSHFVREEQIALPPLGLLAPLSRSSSIAGMRAVLAMTDSLRAELPRMLEEHKAIRAATVRLGEIARAEGNAAVVALTEKLGLHAQTEEDVFYPAAVLVGEVVRARSAMHRPLR